MDKILARVIFTGLSILGGIALARINLIWGILYIAASVAGVLLMAIRWFCPFCPYPAQYMDCLIFPTALTRHFSQYESAKGKKPNAGITFAVIGLLILIPQYWLIQVLPLFLAFWILTIIMVLRAALFLCTRCRYIRCPLNKAGTG